MKRNLNQLIVSAVTLIACTVALLPLAACRKLDPQGVYKGDKVLYNADQTIVNAYDLMHTFVKWEYDNRAILPPAVTKAADVVRANAQKVLGTAIAARKAYADNPASKDALGALQTALDVLSNLLSQIQQYTTK